MNRRVLIIIALVSLLATPAIAGDICGGDFFCALSINLILFARIFLAIAVVVFIFGKLVRPSLALKSLIVWSLVISLVATLMYPLLLSAMGRILLMRDAMSTLHQTPFTLYEPGRIPEGYSLYEARALEFDKSPHLSFTYWNHDAGGFGAGKYFFVWENGRPRTLYLDPPTCEISGPTFIIGDYSSQTNYVTGDCREIRTTKGTAIYLMQYEITEPYNLALALVDQTLVSVANHNLTDKELADFYDGLVEKSPEDIRLKRR